MVQAADRRQAGATSTPPSLPAPAWRRDFSQKHEVERVPPGTFPRVPVEALLEDRPTEQPALAMVLAPVLGLGIWAAMLTVLLR